MQKSLIDEVAEYQDLELSLAARTRLLQQDPSMRQRIRERAQTQAFDATPDDFLGTLLARSQP
ncbi:hypothetical protein [Bordetella sp. 15P40C-2]|uniref:hypothetical protein n=1 Tax=Bordetella sp. 15P40C-2 TaxID=2572246 RepID=UPI001321D335|nr:hypothetical protein [Bordetella sp. 15P40C-2]MVW71507.1 hypothetical protein [Bordetella sp. 15P40C-2]